MLSLLLIRRDRYRCVHDHPLHSLSEEKAVRSLWIHIVTQKNQKKMEIIGTFQIPVDSAEETSGGEMMVIARES